MPDPADGPLHAVRPRGSQQDVLGCRGHGRPHQRRLGRESVECHAALAFACGCAQ